MVRINPLYKSFSLFGRGAITPGIGDLRSPWLLTTYKSWDDPPRRDEPFLRWYEPTGYSIFIDGGLRGISFENALGAKYLLFVGKLAMTASIYTEISLVENFILLTDCEWTSSAS